MIQDVPKEWTLPFSDQETELNKLERPYCLKQHQPMELSSDDGNKYSIHYLMAGSY